MRILVFDKGNILPDVAFLTGSLATRDAITIARDDDALQAAMHGEIAPFRLLVLCDDGSAPLLPRYHAVKHLEGCPPIIVVSIGLNVDTAVSVMKAGAEDVITLDGDNRWRHRLRESILTLNVRQQAHELAATQHANIRDSERRLYEIIEGAAVAMFVIDREHRVTHWNRGCELLTGIAAIDIVATREPWRAFSCEERPCLADLIVDGAGADQVCEYYGAQGVRESPLIPGAFEAEDFFPGFGQGGRWLFFTAAPLHDASGNIVGAVETLQDITDQKLARDALRSNEQLLRQIIECSSVATFVVDKSHRITHWNRACELLLGRKAEAAIGTTDLARQIYRDKRPILADLIVDGADESVVARHYPGKFRRSALLDHVFEIEDFFPTLADGGRWLHFAAAQLKNHAGEAIGAIETLIDITERKHAEAKLQASARLLSQIVDGSAVATFVIDDSHRVTHWNRACAALTGLPSEQLIGTKEQWRAFYADERPCMADLVLDGGIEARVNELYATKRVRRSMTIDGGYEAEDFFPNFGSSGRWLYFTAAPLLDTDGRTVGAIETLQDITEQKRAEDALRQSEERYRVLSITDGMTGLFNARHFALRIREEIDRFQRYQHPLALLVLDVDNFKQFNDTWGHVQGDHVLRRLAECMTHCLRRTDQAFRYGGEEFVALLPETAMADAEAVAERIRAMFAATDISPSATGAVPCSVSIGITTYIKGESVNAFVARADSGTYEAKRRGKNCVVAIEPKPEALNG